MKNRNGIYIIGVDHGYGNIKTANCCFPTGVESSDTEPTFKNDLLIYQGRYYQIGVGHKEYAAEKVMDEDYYILTLAAIARELSREQITQANVFLAAGLPLSWVVKQRKAFQTYLLQNREVEFSFRRKGYRIRFVGAGVFPQGYAAVVQSMETFTGSHMLCDIGNGTMNILQIIDRKPDADNLNDKWLTDVTEFKWYTSCTTTLSVSKEISASLRLCRSTLCYWRHNKTHPICVLARASAHIGWVPQRRSAVNFSLIISLST